MVLCHCIPPNAFPIKGVPGYHVKVYFHGLGTLSLEYFMASLNACRFVNRSFNLTNSILPVAGHQPAGGGGVQAQVHVRGRAQPPHRVPHQQTLPVITRREKLQTATFATSLLTI